MQPIVTTRVILRAWEERHAHDMYEYAKDPRVGPMAGWEPHKSPEESLAIIRNMFIPADDCWAIIWRENGKVIGSLGLHRDSFRPGINSREMGYVLSADYWGKGIMTEAAKAAIAFGFEEMCLSSIGIHHYPHNTASRRVIEKCGFVYEGTLRQARRIYDGSIFDLVSYSILREEYYKNRF